MKVFFSLFFLVSFLLADENSILINAANVLDRFMAIPEERIPPKLFKKAQAIAIIPNLLHGGFVIGAKYGEGVMLVKNKQMWSDPIFIDLYGGSLGWQIGLESIDVIFFFQKKETAFKVLGKGITLGADVSIAVGPIGRAGEVASDITFSAPILSYSRSMGAYVGIAFAGSTLQVDFDANMHFYHCDPQKLYLILSGACKVHNIYLQILKRKLKEYEKWEE